MSHSLPSPLPRFHRALLRTTATLVPPPEREEWVCSWEAELWHACYGRCGRGRRLVLNADLSAGVTLDALWLRTESWRRAYAGTAALCLASLGCLCSVAMLVALAFTGGWHSLAVAVREPFGRFLLATPVVVFVSYATASRGQIDSGPARSGAAWLKRQMFLAAKSALVLLLAFVLSVDACLPLRAQLPMTTDLFQVLFFVVLALVGLRWAFNDEEQRCKHCLRALASPAQVGRPSHNLLEWSGTEQVCRDGHGVLSVPEMLSSWRQSSRWIGQGAALDRVASL